MERRPPDHVLRSRHVVTAGGVADAAVVIRRGRIAAVVPGTDPEVAGARDLGERWLLPGLVDTHVHVNEPGRTEWEGFATAMRAAAGGGVTTIVDMPLNTIPATTSVVALAAKRAALDGRCEIEVGFWGGVVPGNAGELEDLAEAGVLGFKCFLVPSGVPEFPHVGEADLRIAMPIIADMGAPLLVHAELLGPIDRAAAEFAGRDPRVYRTWLDSRPAAAELEAVRLLIRLCREHRCRTHIVHLSAAEALPEIVAAKIEGLPLTVETCPHYLCFEAEQIPDGATEYKCAPPIRERGNRERLWEALEGGVIDLVASDHSPCPPELKCADRGDFMAAWGGIASLELGLAAMWTEARGRGFTPADLVRWMAEGPAKLVSLAGTKGRIAPGCDADLVVWDADAEWIVEPKKLRQRHAVTPYAGRRLYGRVVETWVRGMKVFEHRG